MTHGLSSTLLHTNALRTRQSATAIYQHRCDKDHTESSILMRASVSFCEYLPRSVSGLKALRCSTPAATAATAAFRYHLQPLASPTHCNGHDDSLGSVRFRAPSNARVCAYIYRTTHLQKLATRTRRTVLSYDTTIFRFKMLHICHHKQAELGGLQATRAYMDLPPHREPGKQGTQYDHGRGRQGLTPTLFIVVAHT